MPESRRGSDRFEARKRPIGRLLRDELLSVPIYQRSYSWQQAQLSDYWTDLSGARLQSPPSYFLGTVVVTHEGDDDRWNVVDGQQRLATTAMLIAAIRDKYIEGGYDRRAHQIENDYLFHLNIFNDLPEPKLKLNAEDEPVFTNVILPSPASKQNIPMNRSSHTRMREAAAYFKERIDETVAASGTSWPDELGRWLEFIREHVLVILVEVEDDAEAFTIFETLNDRGLDPTIADLVKNHLFRLAGQSQLAVVNSAWTSATAVLEASGDPKIFTNFLRQYWSSRNGVIRERDLFKEMRKVITTSAHAVTFVSELHDAARLYAALLNSSHDFWNDYGTETRNHIDTLIRFGIEQNRPMLLAAMQYFPNRELKKLMKAAVAWAIRGQVTRSIGGGATERAYAEAGVDIRSGKLKTATDVFKSLVNIIPSNDEFEGAFATLADNRAKFDRFYLIQLENMSRPQGEPELVPNRDENQINLEHIYARNADASDWPQFAAVEPEDWIWRLGNLVLMKKSQNNKLGNEPFATKKPILAKSDLLLTKETANEADWTPKAIQERQERLAKLAVEAWPREP